LPEHQTVLEEHIKEKTLTSEEGKSVL